MLHHHQLGHGVQGRRRPGRSIQPIGDPGQEGLTDSQQRLAKRRWHNRESAKRSRSKRQIDAEDQAAKVTQLHAPTLQIPCATAALTQVQEVMQMLNGRQLTPEVRPGITM